MGTNTQVSSVWPTWVPVDMPYHGRHLMPPLPEALALVVPTWYLGYKAPTVALEPSVE
jgi:hypothetical protein